MFPCIHWVVVIHLPSQSGNFFNRKPFLSGTFSLSLSFFRYHPSNILHRFCHCFSQGLSPHQGFSRSAQARSFKDATWRSSIDFFDRPTAAPTRNHGSTNATPIILLHLPSSTNDSKVFFDDCVWITKGFRGVHETANEVKKGQERTSEWSHSFARHSSASGRNLWRTSRKRKGSNSPYEVEQGNSGSRSLGEGEAFLKKGGCWKIFQKGEIFLARKGLLSKIIHIASIAS